MSSVPGVIGDTDGIKLWTLMAGSQDAREQQYFRQLQTAASQWGEVYFSDLLTQISTEKNQTTWRMYWDAPQNSWNVVLFHIPEGAERVSPRVTDSETQQEAWEDVAVDDLVE